MPLCRITLLSCLLLWHFLSLIEHFLHWWVSSTEFEALEDRTRLIHVAWCPLHQASSKYYIGISTALLLLRFWSLYTWIVSQSFFLNSLFCFFLNSLFSVPHLFFLHKFTNIYKNLTQKPSWVLFIRVQFGLILMHLMLSNCLGLHHLSVLICYSSWRNNHYFCLTVFFLLLPFSSQHICEFFDWFMTPAPLLQQFKSYTFFKIQLNSLFPNTALNSVPPPLFFLKNFVYLLFPRYLLQVVI